MQSNISQQNLCYQLKRKRKHHKMVECTCTIKLQKSNHSVLSVQIDSQYFCLLHPNEIINPNGRHIEHRYQNVTWFPSLCEGSKRNARLRRRDSFAIIYILKTFVKTAFLSIRGKFDADGHLVLFYTGFNLDGASSRRKIAECTAFAYCSQIVWLHERYVPIKGERDTVAMFLDRFHFLDYWVVNIFNILSESGLV